MKNNKIRFFKSYLEAVRASEKTRKNTLSIVKMLSHADPLRKTKYEASFKIKNNKILPISGFTNIDANCYSCKSKQDFLLRLHLYEKIIRHKIKNPLLRDAILALREVSETPMDLYFGAYIDISGFLFSFCLIFGGTDKNGIVTYWPYDINKMILNILKKMGLKPPATLKKNIFHMSINISEHDIYYELYYEKVPIERIFEPQIKKIKDNFADCQHHFCSSQAFNKKGVCTGQKLFLYIPNGFNTNTKSLNKLLKKVNGVGKINLEPKGLLKALASVKGEINLLGFEPGNAINFYTTVLSQ